MAGKREEKMVRSVALVLATIQFIYTSSALAQTPTSLPPTCDATTPSQIQRWITRSLSCGFDRAAMRYAGSPVEQARCLLRSLQVGSGEPESRTVALPAALEALVGNPVSLERGRLEAYLDSRHIASEEVGGSVTAPLSRTSEGHPAAYFVIHDTSSPEYGTRPFRPEIDDPAWRFNSAAHYRNSPDAHVYITRSGVSIAARDYGVPWRAVKAELCVLLERSRGLFLHTELVQPRRSATREPPGYQELAPEVAFTPAQLDRLALVYVAASMRAGRWLIPAYHGAIDEHLPGGHDDPQRFDIADWSARLTAVIASIQGGD